MRFGLRQFDFRNIWMFSKLGAESGPDQCDIAPIQAPVYNFLGSYWGDKLCSAWGEELTAWQMPSTFTFQESGRMVPNGDYWGERRSRQYWGLNDAKYWGREDTFWGRADNEGHQTFWGTETGDRRFTYWGR